MITEQTTPFIVKKEGEIVTDQTVWPPKATAATIITDWITELAMQGKTALYDKLHGTNYREIRNYHRAQARDARFEAAIGLSRVSHT